MRSLEVFMVGALGALVGCAHGQSADAYAAADRTARPESAERADVQPGKLAVTPTQSVQEPLRDEKNAAEAVGAESPPAAIAGATPSRDGTVEPKTSAPASSAVSDLTRPEIALRNRIQDALLKQSSLSYSAQRAHVAVDKHDVTVTGDVRTARERADVEAVIAKIRGVDHVHNQLAVISQVDVPASHGAPPDNTGPGPLLP